MPGELLESENGFAFDVQRDAINVVSKKGENVDRIFGFNEFECVGQTSYRKSISLRIIAAHAARTAGYLFQTIRSISAYRGSSWHSGHDYLGREKLTSSTNGPVPTAAVLDLDDRNGRSSMRKVERCAETNNNLSRGGVSIP